VARGIDHIAHAVRDLDAAAEFYRRLGFQVSGRNHHPPVWGTQNHIVQLAGSYIELLGVADESAGLSMVALEGRGAPDAAEFRAAGIGDFEPFELERKGRQPDGTVVKFAFTLVFAADPGTPHIGFFTCRNHFPENFWNPALQVHANGAVTVAGVVLVAENPSDHHIFLSAFVGERELLATSSGISIKTPRGEIQMMTPEAFHDHFNTEPPDSTGGARLAAQRFAVRDIDATAKLLEHAGLPHHARIGRLVVGPQTAMGATLAFEPI
jgi:catechol 2,3-dioxygenase-like lactoylglutathione lyase family enzyme